MHMQISSASTLFVVILHAETQMHLLELLVAPFPFSMLFWLLRAANDDWHATFIDALVMYVLAKENGHQFWISNVCKLDFMILKQYFIFN